ITGHCMNIPRGGYHFPDARVAGIRNEEVPGTVEEYALGVTQCSADGGAAVSAEPKGSIPGHRLNIPRGGHHFPDARVASIRNEEVTETVDEYALGATQCSAGGGAAVAAEPHGSIAGHRRHIPYGGHHFPDATVASFGPENFHET